MYDVYQSKRHPAERMATRTGAGLPGHVAARDWEMAPPSMAQFIDDVQEEVAARGFSYFKLL